MTIKVAINGFGRIGRAVFKSLLTKKNVQVVAINDLTDTETLAHLLKYDTVYGNYENKTGFDEKNIIIAGKKYPVYTEKDPNLLPWGKLKVDVVLECSGRFTKDGAAFAHIKAGAKKVVVSAPVGGAGDIKTFVFGVNAQNYKGEQVISNASCTTNCIAPVTAVIADAFGITKGMMTTIHSYTAEQNLIDGPVPPLHKDLRRARAAACNIIPTTTGAAKALCDVLPVVKNKFDGMAMRVPTPCGSLADFTFLVSKKTTAEEVNKAFTDAAKKPIFKNVLTCTKDPIVSSDIIGNPYSTIVDLSLTKVVDGDMVKVIAWYDNEYAYACRLAEMAALVAQV